MPWSVAAAVAGAVVTSAMSPSPSDNSAASTAADPFASQRPQYQTMLSAMMTGKNADGSAYNFQSSDPSYQFRLQQGLDATNASQASTGNLNSGNRAIALTNYAENSASTEYANQFSRLSQLAGGNIGSPAAAGQIINGQNTANSQAAAGLGSSVGQAISGWGNGATSGAGSGLTSAFGSLGSIFGSSGGAAADSGMISGMGDALMAA